MQNGPNDAPLTVLLACHRFTEKVRAAKGDAAANELAARYRRWVESDPLAGCVLSKLTSDQLKQFRVRLISAPVTGADSKLRPRQPATAFRDLAVVRAALNQAIADGLVTDDSAWRSALRVTREASRHQLPYITRSLRGQFISVASKSFKPMAQALCLLPLPPSVLISLKVESFDVTTGEFHNDLLVGDAPLKLALPPDVSSFLTEIIRDRLGSERLIVRSSGAAWSIRGLSRRVQRYARAAEFPTSSPIQALRHSVIIDMLRSGISYAAVGQLSGISVSTLSKLYEAICDNDAPVSTKRTIPTQ
ncbi:hypothetical protein FHW83_003357 [Duganella sp. SG902]|uniref:site-specific integrase n=1 Tax=Duganella sp. SG902 TaxID=2587016 RepID=UPI00159DF527|nr:site-specific integrase [Duganella sp. SG902]NVM77539.1 hypothetical protein [Duganella sp. SG902]